MIEKRYLILCLLSLVVLITIERPHTYLFEPDEARYAEIPREMLASGDYISPRQNGSLYMEKPPLLYWLNAGSLKIFGENPFAARLPSRLAALGVILLLILLLSSPEAPLRGWWAALIYSASLLPFALSRVNITDGLLTFTLTLAFLSVWKWIESLQNGKARRRWEIGIGLGCALSVLTKGLIGIVFPGTVFLIYVIMRREWRIIPKIIFSLALPVFLIVSVPWFVLVQKANPQFFDFFFINEHFRRFTTTIHRRQEPFYFFILIFLAGFVPWTIPFVLRLWNLVKKWKDTLNSPDLFFLIWFLFILVFFSLSHSKLIPYILPAMPAVAILMARALETKDEVLEKGIFPTTIFITLVIVAMFVISHQEQLTERYIDTIFGFLPLLLALATVWLAALQRKNLEKAYLWLSLTWVGLGISAFILLPPVSARYSAEPLALKAIEMKPDQIVSYNCYPETLPWTLKKPVPVVEFAGELASIGPKNPELFWSPEKFWSEWNSPKHLAVIFRDGDKSLFESLSKCPVAVLARNKRHMLAVNFSTEEAVMPAKAGIQVLNHPSKESLRPGSPLSSRFDN